MPSRIIGPEAAVLCLHTATRRRNGQSPLEDTVLQTRYTYNRPLIIRATHKALQLWKAASGEEDRLDDGII